ncbi:hypothetical protein POM88_008428 [Heracleum sosnowskyi]|uniref:Uncharacterized protein n=1 Tax=Heracleum sosnowskyi TaxID=360622 RepID=A0AAD8N1Q1_9APIA|nr:hypothetical protein POM88_008428 [Heracleum sosnowskyi]
MDPDNELSMNPGPRDPSVLHLQSIHRSTAVWAAGGGDTQRSRKHGEAVIGITAVDGGWDHIIEEIFGQSPVNQLVGGRLKLSWLTKCFPSLSDNASDLELRRYTQSYLLQLITGVLFTDKSGGMIHCIFPTIAPIPRGPSLDNSNIWGSQSGPYGMRWCSQLNFGETSAHVVSTHRLALDGLAPSHFIWQPYSEFLFTAPKHLIDGHSNN